MFIDSISISARFCNELYLRGLLFIELIQQSSDLTTLFSNTYSFLLPNATMPFSSSFSRIHTFTSQNHILHKDTDLRLTAQPKFIALHREEFPLPPESIPPISGHSFRLRALEPWTARRLPATSGTGPPGMPRKRFPQPKAPASAAPPRLRAASHARRESPATAQQPRSKISGSPSPAARPAARCLPSALPRSGRLPKRNGAYLPGAGGPPLAVSGRSQQQHPGARTPPD